MDRTLSGATIPGQSEAMAMKAYSAFPKAPASLEPHHHIVSVIFRTLVGGGVLHLYSRCILQPPPADWATHLSLVYWFARLVSNLYAIVICWIITASINFPYRDFGACHRGVMAKAMDCKIVVSEFVLQTRYYVHFRTNTLWKGMNPLILPPIGQIVPPLFF